MIKIKHSKFKNTGILFELLVRQVTADILNDSTEYTANKILKEFFSDTTELGKELKLYQLLIQEKAKDSVNADRIVETIVKARGRISEKKLNEQKYNLIKTIKENYPLDDFLKGNISNYKLLASVYKLFEVHVSDRSHDPSESLRSREVIIENLLGGKNVLIEAEKDRVVEQYNKLQEDHRLLTYKMLVDSFNKKYSVLDTKQKLLLREYINNVSNTNSLKSYIATEVPLVKLRLDELKSNIKDKVVQIKLDETIRQLSNITKGSTVKDSQVTSLLLSYELIKELKKVTDNE